MKGIILYKCGRNINRVYRLCYVYGIENLYLLDCSDCSIGNTFSASGKVNVHILRDLNEISGSVYALEKTGNYTLNELPKCDYLIVGGENVTIRKKMCDKIIKINTENDLCLTVDQALAIALNTERMMRTECKEIK